MEKLDASMEEFLDYWQGKWPYATRDINVLERSAHFRGCCDAWFAARQDTKESPCTVKQQANYEICPKCGGSGRVYMCAEDGDGIKCHRCGGSGKLS